MKGFKLVCNNCGREIEFDMDKFKMMVKENDEYIIVETNMDGAIEEIKCKCGNEIID